MIFLEFQELKLIIHAFFSFLFVNFMNSTNAQKKSVWAHLKEDKQLSTLVLVW